MAFLGHSKFEPLTILFPHYPSFSLMAATTACILSIDRLCLMQLHNKWAYTHLLRIREFCMRQLSECARETRNRKKGAQIVDVAPTVAIAYRQIL